MWGLYGVSAQDPVGGDVAERLLAAVRGAHDQLSRPSSRRRFSYGGGEDASEYWRSAEEDSSEQPKPMRALATILTLPFTRNESGSYAWPTAYNESPTEDDWQALVDAGLYDADVIDQMQTQGTGYLGYRTAITPDGDWQFFVAGD